MTHKVQQRQRSSLPQFFSYSIAAVWLINGLYCKVLNFVPRTDSKEPEIVQANYEHFKQQWNEHFGK